MQSNEEKRGLNHHSDHIRQEAFAAKWLRDCALQDYAKAQKSDVSGFEIVIVLQVQG
jgi:hypothetical protein